METQTVSDGQQKPAHTSGPWRLIDDAQGPCMVMHPTKAGVAIANLSGVFRPAEGFHADEGSKSWPHERNANARLIAAAPETHESADEFLAVALEALTDVPLPNELVERFRAAEQKLRAALAKARVS